MLTDKDSDKTGAGRIGPHRTGPDRTGRDRATIELTLERAVAGGRMLARHDGRIVLVAGAIPGERVRARVDRVQRGVAFATTLDVLQGSAQRRVPVGDPLCGGNVYAHVASEGQAAIKREVLRDALRHGGRIEWPGELPVASSPEHSYRMRARLHVRRGRVGFFREGTHDLCDCAGTGQLLPAAVEAVRALVDAAPRAVRDAIDAVDLTESIAGDQRALHLLWSPHARIAWGTVADLWHVDRLPGVAGLSCDDPSTGRARTLDGEPWVSDPLDAVLRSIPSLDPVAPDPDARLQRHATSFFQANRFLLPDLVAAVHRAVTDGPIVDLYAGVGLFAVTLAARGRGPVLAIEGDPSSARDLAVNGAPFGARLEVEQIAVEQAPIAAFLARHADAASAGTPSSGRATLIVDPPRTGMSRAALDGVLRADVGRLVYVSCDVATLARDLRRFLDAGYRLDHVEAFDLFPNTAHVESLVVLSRAETSATAAATSGA